MLPLCYNSLEIYNLFVVLQPVTGDRVERLHGFSKDLRNILKLGCIFHCETNMSLQGLQWFE